MTEQVDPQHRAVSKLASKWLAKVELRASEARARLETDWAALPPAVKATFRNQPTSIVLQFNPSGVSDCVLPTHLNVPHIQSVVQRALTCISHELFSQQLAHGKHAPCTLPRAQPRPWQSCIAVQGLRNPKLLRQDCCTALALRLSLSQRRLARCRRPCSRHLHRTGAMQPCRQQQLPVSPAYSSQQRTAKILKQMRRSQRQTSQAQSKQAGHPPQGCQGSCRRPTQQIRTVPR